MENKMEKEFIDPKIKEEINKEGFEEGAAVLVGKKEEMPQLLERLEKEGRANDLGSYIRMHKEIKLPKEESSPDLLDALTKNKGLLWWMEEKKGGEKYKYFFPESIVYNYIDKDGNVASFNLDPEKLTPTREIIEQRIADNQYYSMDAFSEIIKESAKELGFNWSSPNIELIININREILDYQKRLEIESKKKKEAEFDL